MELKDKIRKELIDSIVDWYEDDGITKEIAAKLIDKLFKDNDYLPKETNREFDIEKEDLFGKSIKETCEYLKSLENKFGKGTLEEKWSGYEDNYFVYEYFSLENEEDIFNRLYNKAKEEAKHEAYKIEEDRKKKEKIKALEKELSELRRSCEY